MVMWEFTLYEKMNPESEDDYDVTEYERQIEEEIREEMKRDDPLKGCQLREWTEKTYRTRRGELRVRGTSQVRAVVEWGGQM